MDKYIVVKVEDADRNSMWPEAENPFRTNLAIVRKAIHEVAEDRGMHIADMPTHTRHADYHPSYLTTEESDDIARIFERALSRARVYKKNSL